MVFRILRAARVLVLLGLYLGSLPSDAAARPSANEKIPPNVWGCTLCHNGAGVAVDFVPASTASARTVFGQQWFELAPNEIDRAWGVMAALNADGDGCSNGCELRDPFGAYRPGDDPPTTRCADGDPNLADCTIPLNEDSWSTLKALFGDN